MMTSVGMCLERHYRIMLTALELIVLAALEPRSHRRCVLAEGSRSASALLEPLGSQARGFAHVHQKVLGVPRASNHGG